MTASGLTWYSRCTMTDEKPFSHAKRSAVIPYESLHDAASGYASIRLKIKSWPPLTATARKQKCNGDWPPHPRGDILAAPGYRENNSTNVWKGRLRPQARWRGRNPLPSFSKIPSV
jgi:hypothetical protein